MKILLSFILLIFVSLSVFSQEEKVDIYKINPNYDKTSKTGIYIPKDLDESFVELKKMLHPKFIEKYKKGEIKPIFLHHGFGTWLRNNWGLWQGERLAKYFNEKGIFHPDDMSGIILDTFQLHLNGKPLELEKKIQFYKDYWEAAKEPSEDESKFAGCPQGVEIRGSFNPLQKEENEKYRQIHYGYCKSDSKLWVFERGKGWFEPTEEMLEIINN